MRNLFFGLSIYVLVVSVLFHDIINLYATFVGVLLFCVLSGLLLGNVLGAISLRIQERNW